MKNPKKDKPLFVDEDGLGRLTLPKSWLSMLGWEKGDKIAVVLDIKDESISVRKA